MDLPTHSAFSSCGGGAEEPWRRRSGWRAVVALAVLAGAAGLARAAVSDVRLTDQSSPVYYRYALVAGEKILVTGPAEITGNLHSNDDVDLMNGSAVTGNVSAAGTLTLHGTVTGATEEGADAVTLPALASAEELSGIAGRVEDGNVQLTDAVIDEILFVNGNVRISGGLDGTGTIIATGNIRLDGIDDGVEVPLAAATRLSLIAFNDIRIEKNRPFRGVLYAQRDVVLQKDLRFAGVAIAGRTISVDKDSRIGFVDFDTTAPQVTVVSPANGAILRTATLTIEATWSDDFSGLDLATVLLRLDGEDRTAEAEVDADGLRFTPAAPLSDGAHTVEVSVTDHSDNTGSATATFHVVLDDQPPVVAISSPTEGQVVSETPFPVIGTVTDQSAIASVTVNGVAATVTGNVFTASVPLADGSNTLIVEARDVHGNLGTASVSVTLSRDDVPPQISITSPASGSFVLQVRPEIAVSFSDESGVDTSTLGFTVNGSPVAVSCQSDEQSARCAPEHALPEEAVTLVASIEDTFGNSGSATVQFVVDTTSLEVAVTSPEDRSITRDAEVEVTGTVSSGVVRVDVNGVPASMAGGSFTATVPLREGINMVVALATKTNGRTGTSTIELTRDLVTPIVRIDSPRDGFVSINDQIAVTGLVNDAVTGGVTPRVLVNGAEARVANGAFVLDGLQLVRGPNVIEAVGTDAVGNTGRHSITVLYQPAVGARVGMASGNGQVAPVNQTLSQPLVAVVADDLGNPMAGRLVRFEVTRNSGTLRAKAGDEPARVVQVPTDGNGRASVLFTLGDTTGEGNNRVRASALGVAGEVEFCASGFSTMPEKIVMTMGDNQRGVVGQPLPMPLIAGVLDRDGNPVEGVDVTFMVTKGTGHLDSGQTLVKTTGIDGHVRAMLTLGLEPGINNNVVTASFEGLTGLPATFTASGVAPGDPAQTRFSGVVLDNAHTPIPGTVVDIGGTGLQAVTDEQGQFLIENVPVGHIHLHIDPAGSPRPETFAPLAFETVTIAGQENTLGQPILLPALDTEGSKIVGGNQDVTLTMKGVEGVQLTVFANSATFLDGSRTGRLTISQVHLDKVPMAPPDGTIFMAPTWTIQPHGVHFDPPAQITIPNNGLPPGRLVDIYQFDHALNQFISVGKGTVSKDGATITSDPGFGITAAGWGGGAPPPPPTTCTPSCAPPKQLECRTEAKKLVVVSTRPCIFFCLPQNTDKPDGTPCTDDSDKCTRDVCEDGSCQHPKVPELDGPGHAGFCATNPLCCLSAYNCMETAFMFETSVTGRDPGYCDVGDAIRHTYWMCCISKARGRDCAVGFGNAHEVSGPPTEPCESHMQDFHNNSQGADLGQLQPACEQTVLNALANGSLVTSAKCR